MTKDTLDAIDALASLRAGWDSYGAGRVPRSLREQAKAFLSSVGDMVGREYTNPIVTPTAEPGVALIWRKGSDPEVEVFFSSKGARYVVLRAGRLLKRGSVTDPASFATQVIKKYVSP